MLRKPGSGPRFGLRVADEECAYLVFLDGSLRLMLAKPSASESVLLKGLQAYVEPRSLWCRGLLPGYVSRAFFRARQVSLPSSTLETSHPTILQL